MTATVTRIDTVKKEMERVLLTPEMATQLLEHNAYNRPVSDAHVSRIARQIIEDKWKFNGDTIKISETNDVLDGQHRLWAVIEAKRAIETIIVRGIARDAFATVDTIRKQRSGADILSLAGANKSRLQVAAAVKWLVSYQKTNQDLKLWKKPEFRVENSDIELTFKHHPAIAEAVERVKHLHDLMSIGALAFVYYVAVSKNQELADQMIEILDAPAGTAQSNPFFRLRQALIADRKYFHKNSLIQIALAFKALNAAKEGKRMERLIWKSQGEKAEEFPRLKI